MTKIKKILISALISLIFLLISMYFVNLSSNKDVIKIPIALAHINEGMPVKDILYIEIKAKDLSKDIFDDVIKNNELIDKVALSEIRKGELILNHKVTSKDNYLLKIENFEVVSLPIKSVNEGISYKLKKGDDINVYYTAKKKAVDGILKSKTKVYSTNKEESMVTCLLYQNIEVLALINNMGIEVSDGTATNILVRLNRNEILELANLKEQGIFTYSLI